MIENFKITVSGVAAVLFYFINTQNCSSSLNKRIDWVLDYYCFNIRVYSTSLPAHLYCIYADTLLLSAYTAIKSIQFNR